ncbi:tetratricopeptide repeat protein [Candidatus Poribacteria bacterium]|nr:tetratricopeptide repeat protein [Candidatus Poribacteria bacterium]
MNENDKLREIRKVEFLDTKRHMKLGLSLFKKGEYERAIEQFKLILLHDKGCVRAYNNLGYSYRTIGDYEKALAAWEEGLKVDSSYKRLQKNILSLQTRLKSAEEKAGPLPVGIEDFEAEIEWISENAELVELREGRFFDVYLLEDGGDRYALKTPKRPFSDRSETLKAFERSCSGWLRLDPCEYIVKASSIERVKGKPFLTVEHLRGGSLRRFLQGLPGDSPYGKRPPAKTSGDASLSLPRMLDLGVQACIGLQFIHKQLGAAHGDIRPEKLLLEVTPTDPKERQTETKSDRYVLKVTDVGLWATFAESQLYCDANGQLLPGFSDMGLVRAPSGFLTPSPSSCAPELLESIRTPNILTDVYSLGVVLYEILTGTVPFVGSRSAEILDEIRNRPEHPSTVNPAVPRVIGDVAMRCIERNPRARFDNFIQIADSLISWMDVNGTAIENMKELCKRYRKVSTHQFKDEEKRASVMIVGGTEFCSETDQIWEILKRRANDERDAGLTERLDEIEKALRVPGLSIGELYPTAASIIDAATLTPPGEYRDRLVALASAELAETSETMSEPGSARTDEPVKRKSADTDNIEARIFGPEIAEKHIAFMKEGQRDLAARLLADALKFRAELLLESPNGRNLLSAFDTLRRFESFPAWVAALMQELSSRSSCPAPVEFLEKGMETPREMIAAVCGLLFMLGGEFAASLETFNMISEERYLPSLDIYLWAMAKFQSQKMEKIRLNSLKNAGRMLREAIVSARDRRKRSTIVYTSLPDAALADAFFLRGLVLEQSGEHRHAVDHFRACKRIVDLNVGLPKKTIAWANLVQGKCMYDLGMPSEALLRWQRVLTLDLAAPFLASLEVGRHSPRSLMSAHLLKCCESALSRFGDNPMLWTLKGKLLNCCGETDDAHMCASRALTLDDGFYPAHFIKMESLLTQQRNSEAFEAVHICALREPHDPLFMLREAELLCRLGEPEKALLELRRAIGHALDVFDLRAAINEGRLAALESHDDFRSIVEHLGLHST